MRSTTPVRVIPVVTTKSPTRVMIVSLPKPASASVGVRMLAGGRRRRSSRIWPTRSTGRTSLLKRTSPTASRSWT